MTSVVLLDECPAKRAISSTGTPASDSSDTNECRSSRGVQFSPIPAALQAARRAPTGRAGKGMPRLGLVHSPDGGAYLSMLADLADDRKLSGAHVTIYRHPRPKVGARRIIGRAQIED